MVVGQVMVVGKGWWWWRESGGAGVVIANTNLIGI